MLNTFILVISSLIIIITKWIDWFTQGLIMGAGGLCTYLIFVQNGVL